VAAESLFSRDILGGTIKSVLNPEDVRAMECSIANAIAAGNKLAASLASFSIPLKHCKLIPVGIRLVFIDVFQWNYQ